MTAPVTFDTAPLSTKQNRKAIRDFGKKTLQTDFGREKDARARKLVVKYLTIGLAAAVLLALWNLHPVHLFVDTELPHRGDTWWLFNILGWITAVFCLVLCLPVMFISWRGQWLLLYRHREFAFVNDMEVGEGNEGIGDKRGWKGLPFLQGYAAFTELNYRSKSDLVFDIGNFHYTRPWFQTPAEALANTPPHTKRETWGYVRIPLAGGLDLPRIVIRPTEALRPTSPQWQAFTYLEPYWTNPGVVVHGRHTYGLYAPLGFERAAAAFFTPEVVDLLAFEGQPLEAEVVGDALYIYKPTLGWLLGWAPAWQWLETVLRTVDTTVFQRLAFTSQLGEGSDIQAPTEPAPPLAIPNGSEPIIVTGPATKPPYNAKGGFTKGSVSHRGEPTLEGLKRSEVRRKALDASVQEQLKANREAIRARKRALRGK